MDLFNLKQKIRNQQCLVGSWINTASPITAELMASIGFDFLTVDVEHSAIDIATVQLLFQAMRSGNPSCTPLVRLQGHSYSETKRYMDAGAGGVVAPLVNKPEEAEEVIHAVKYPPRGSRGVGFCRANGYGMQLHESVSTSNAESWVCIQIEHADALPCLDKILSVPDIDAVMIGPYDLSASMGITAQFDHPEFLRVSALILESCRRHGIVPGIHVVQPDVDDACRRYKEGYRFIAYSLDITMLIHHFSKDLQNIRNFLKP